MSASDVSLSVLTYLGRLAVFVNDVYINGGIYTKDGSSHDRDAYELQQRRIFTYDGRDAYRISTPLKKFLDDVTHRQKLFDSMGEAAGPLVKQLLDLQTEFGNAHIDGQTEYMDTLADRFGEVCAELSDTFTSGIGVLFNQAESNFGLVKTISSKIKQSQHYYKQTQLFSDALQWLDRFAIEKTFEANHADTRGADMTALERRYRILIGERRSEWHADLARLLHFFETYLFRMRNIAPDVKRFRDFANHLNQNPGYEFPSFDDRTRLPSCIMLAAKLDVVTYADVNDPASGEYLVDIAARLPAPKEVIVKERVVGKINRQTNKTKPSPPEPAHLAAVIEFIAVASKSPYPISAIEWKRENQPELVITNEMWLMYVYGLRYSKNPKYQSISFRRATAPKTSSISCNLTITDVFAHGR